MTVVQELMLSICFGAVIGNFLGEVIGFILIKVFDRRYRHCAKQAEESFNKHYEEKK